MVWIVIVCRHRVKKIFNKKIWEDRTNCGDQVQSIIRQVHQPADWHAIIPVLHSFLSILPLFLPSPPSSARCMFTPSHSNTLNPQVCILLSCKVPVCLQFLDTSSTSLTDSFLLIVFINVNWTGFITNWFLSAFLYPLSWKKKAKPFSHPTYSSG